MSTASSSTIAAATESASNLSKFRQNNSRLNHRTPPSFPGVTGSHQQTPNQQPPCRQTSLLPIPPTKLQRSKQPLMPTFKQRRSFSIRPALPNRISTSEKTHSLPAAIAPLLCPGLQLLQFRQSHRSLLIESSSNSPSFQGITSCGHMHQHCDRQPPSVTAAPTFCRQLLTSLQPNSHQLLTLKINIFTKAPHSQAQAACSSPQNKLTNTKYH
ncbi:hypothetical protein KC19_VG115200 [Ceratodon purpureus]|uniref:Uncharacterized protein n=1 Tax=Ceratodon purpureus TaxID=3225 RepID=A0A8T0HPB1_CERPU|nr:hypothetical protein KC19_VG115200 [Ceratodon purpureus]